MFLKVNLGNIGQNTAYAGVCQQAVQHTYNSCSRSVRVSMSYKCQKKAALRQLSVLVFHVGFNRCARAHQVAVAIGIVYAAHARPELVFVQVIKRVSGFLAAVG
jgi:hypothetical protein